MMDKRIPEASALREFFSDQLQQLRQLVAAKQQRHRHEHEQQQRVDNAIEQIVERVDNRIRGIGSYKNRLRHCACELINHVRDIVAGLPAAIPVAKESYIDESLINAIFASKAELEQLIRCSAEIERFASEHSQRLGEDGAAPEFYALLFVVKEERQVFGSELKEGVLQKDVPQMVVNFFGHQLVAPTLSEQEARSALERVLFESAIAALRSNMVKLRHSQSAEEKIKAALNPQININNPEVYLKLLVEQLNTPKNIITLQSNTIKVSRMGVLLPADLGGQVNELILNELTIGENRSQIVALIRLRWCDWSA